jgi:DNA-binding transcriptional LysR family regulator
MQLNVLELRALRYFAAVAEEEHVGRASARLHVSQSPLSRQIRKFEDDLGLSLFVREKKRLRLTPTGRWLLGEARALLAHAERLEKEAAGAARGFGHLVVGFVRTALWSGVLPAALRELRTASPDVRVELRAMTSAAQIAAVTRGEIGLALVHMNPSVPGLVAKRVLDERDVLLLPREHALAKSRDLAPGDLNGTPWVALSHDRERFVAQCAGVGFMPRIAYGARDSATVLGLVEAGMGLAVLPRCAVRAASAEVVMREPAWLPFSTRLYAVWSAAGNSAATARLASLLRTVAPATKRAARGTTGHRAK